MATISDINIDGAVSGASLVADLQAITNASFSSSSAVSAPSPVGGTGMLWYSTTANQLNVYNGTQFSIIPIDLSGAIGVIDASSGGLSGITYSAFDPALVDEDIDTGVSASHDTIASALAIKTYIDNTDAAHTALTTGVHGVAGTVVGTSDTQTLTNKTLTAPVIDSISGLGTLSGLATITAPANLAVNVNSGAGLMTVTGGLTVTGDLTVSGTTTTVNSTTLDVADHDLKLDSGATTAGAIQDGAGIVLGAGAFESLTFSNTNDRWDVSNDLNVTGGITASSSLTANDLIVGATTVVTNSLDWGGNVIPVTKGGTGKSSVTSNTVLIGNGTGAMTERTIGDGLTLGGSDITVNPSDFNLQELGDVVTPATPADNGKVLFWDATDWKLTTNTVDISLVEDWGRVDTGIADPTLANMVLSYTGAAYTWIDVASLDLGLDAGDSISVTGVTTSGTLASNGNTTLGNSASDTIALSGVITTDIIPNGNGIQNLGSNLKRYNQLHVNDFRLAGKTATDIDKSADTLSTSDVNIPTSKAVRDYVDTFSNPGMVVITGTGKTVDTDEIATVSIVTTRLFRAKNTRTGVIKGTDFDGSGGGQDFLNTTNWEEIDTGQSEGGVSATVLNSFVGNGSTTVFTLTQDPVNEDNTTVYIDGIYQNKSSYTTTATTIDFGVGNPVPNGANLEVIIGAVTTAASASFTAITVSGDASAASFTGGSFSGTTFTGTSFAGTHTGDGSGLTGISFEGDFTEPKASNGSTEGFRFTTSGAGYTKDLNLIYRNASAVDVTVATISVSDLLDGVTLDDLGA